MRGVDGVVEIVEELRGGFVGLQVGGAGVFPDHADLGAGREPPGVHRVDVEDVVGVVAVALVGGGGFGTLVAQGGEIAVAHVAGVLAQAQREGHAVGEGVDDGRHVGCRGHVAAAQQGLPHKGLVEDFGGI